MLAISLRPGNANANHAHDHLEVLGRAIGQIPASHRRKILIRADTAGATHELLDWLTAQRRVGGRSVEYSVGFPTNKGPAVHEAIQRLPARAWTPALDADGDTRDGAEVAEVTGLLELPPAGQSGCASSSVGNDPTPGRR